MADFTIVGAEYFCPLLDVFLLGIYTCICGIILWLVLKSRVRLTPATWAIFILYFLNLANTIVMLVDGYRTFVTDPLGPLGHLVNHENGLKETFSNTTVTLAAIVADATLLWRLYIIWFRDLRIIIIPALGSALGVSCSFAITVLAAHPGQVVRPRTPTIAKLIYITFGSSLVITWFITALIVGRLYYVGRQSAGDHRRTYTRIIVALVEGGALFSLAMAIYVTLYSTGSYGGDIVISVLPKVIGITPTLIILQLHLGFVQPADAMANDVKTTIVFAPQTSTPFNSSGAMESQSDQKSLVFSTSFAKERPSEWSTADVSSQDRHSDVKSVPVEQVY